MGGSAGGNGRVRPGRQPRCRSMRGCVESGSRCCAGNPDSEPIRAPWRMLSSGPRRVVVSTTTAASSRLLVLQPGRCGVVGGRDDAAGRAAVAVGGINAGSAPTGVRFRPGIRCRYGTVAVAGVAAALLRERERRRSARFERARRSVPLFTRPCGGRVFGRDTRIVRPQARRDPRRAARHRRRAREEVLQALLGLYVRGLGLPSDLHAAVPVRVHEPIHDPNPPPDALDFLLERRQESEHNDDGVL